MKRKHYGLWCVVVGQPRLENWDKANQPGPGTLATIGRPLVGLPDTNDPRLGYKVFNTRKEARAEAKQAAKDNRFWHFHPKKIGPI